MAEWEDAPVKSAKATTTTKVTSNASDGWEDAPEVAKAVESSPTQVEASTPSRGAQLAAGAASAVDFVASMPAMAMGVGADLGSRVVGTLASPFTGESAKEIAQGGRRAAETVNQTFGSPMGKIMSALGEAEAYEKAPLNQAMSWMAEKIKAGGDIAEKATGGVVSSEDVASLADTAMVAGVPTGAHWAAGKVVKALTKEKPVGEVKPGTVREEPTVKPPENEMPPAERPDEFLVQLEKMAKEKEAARIKAEEEAKAKEPTTPPTEEAPVPPVEGATKDPVPPIEEKPPVIEEPKKPTELTDDEFMASLPRDSKGKLDFTKMTKEQDARYAAIKDAKPKEFDLPKTREENISAIETMRGEAKRLQLDADLAHASGDRAEGARIDAEIAAINKHISELEKHQETIPPETRTEYIADIENIDQKIAVLEQEGSYADVKGDKQKVDDIALEIATLEHKKWALERALPESTAKGKTKINAEEFREIVYGAKTVGDAIAALIKHDVGGKGQKQLLSILEGLKLVADTPFTSNKYPKLDPKGTIHGEYWHRHEVEIHGTGELRTFLHEAVHAGSVAILKAGGNRAKAFKKVYNKYADKMLDTHLATVDPAKYQQWKKGLLSREEAVLALRQSAGKGDPFYGLTDVYEFASEAFTNREFQNRLAGMTPEGATVPRGLGSIWKDFKNAVKEALGVTSKEAASVLDEVLDHGSKLLEEGRKGMTREMAAALARKDPVTSNPRELSNAMSSPEVLTDPRLVGSQKEFMERALEIFEKLGPEAALEFRKGFEEYKKTWIEPVKATEDIVGFNLQAKAANERLIHNTVEQMKKEVPDPKMREAIALAVESGDYTHLSPEARVVAERYKGLMTDIGQRAKDLGVIKNLVENYVTHIVDWTKEAKSAKDEFLNALLSTSGRDPTMKGAAPESKYGKGRKYDTFEELQAALRDGRLQLKTMDIAEIYGEYAKSMERAIENKKMIDSLKTVRDGKGDLLLRMVTPEDPMPRGWEMLDSPQFSGYAVRSDLMPAIKFVFDAGPDTIMKALGSISQVTKRLNVIGSFFHAKSLMEVQSSAAIPIWTPLKESIVLPIAEQIAKAVTGTKPQWSGVTKAVEQFKEGKLGDNVDTWIRRDGLQLEVPEDVSTSILRETGKLADSIITKYGPSTHITEKSLTNIEKLTLGQFDKFTWDYLHTGSKLMVADAYLARAREQALRAGRPFDEIASRKEIARFVNESFGGLNWFDAARDSRTQVGKRIAMAAMSPEGRRGMQIILFAPDWTTSTLRAFSSALPKELNPKQWHPIEGAKGLLTPTTKGDYARLYQLKTVITTLTLLNAINMMTANRPIWENKDPSRIEWRDGTSMQAMKHAMEPFHWITDPDKTLSNKLGFIPKAAVVGLAGTEYASPNAQKLVDPSGVGRLKAIAEMSLPFQIQAAKNAPEGEGVKRALLGTAGFPVYGATAAQRKQARAEREKILKQAAKDYHTKAKERGWE